MNIRWMPTDKHVFATFYREHRWQLIPMGTISDPEGTHGEPLMMTEWGFEGSNVPVMKTEDRKGQWSYFVAAVTQSEG